MSGIQITTRHASEPGRLHPRYSKEAGILAVESPVDRPWPYGIDINGNIVFDLDEEKILANFDLHIPRDLWKRDWDADWPTKLEARDVRFTPEAITHKSFDLDVLVRTNHHGPSTHVRIEIGKTSPDKLIALSDHCVALLSGTHLSGFLVRDYVDV